MSSAPILDQLRERVRLLEEPPRRFARTVSIADAIDRRLPHGGLPAGCIHEVKGASLASAVAFSAILGTRLAGEQGNLLYIAPDRSLHPLGLLPYGVKLDRLLHVSARRQRDLAWAVMEALRCSQVSAVMAVIEGIDLTESRRLQLAAETSGATGFFIGRAASAPIASPVTRWKIAAIGKPGQRFDEPAWTLELLYCRGGRPGKWTVEWRCRKLHAVAAKPMGQATSAEPLADGEALAG